MRGKSDASRLSGQISCRNIGKAVLVCVWVLLIEGLSDKVRIVSKEGFGEYQSISEAIASSKSNDYIIVREGIYNEQVLFDDMDLNIIGTNREKCIIENHTGTFEGSSIRANGNFKIENLTVKMTLEEVGDWVPTYTSDIENTYPGYALLIEKENSCAEAKEMHRAEIRNCLFYSEASQAVAVGMNERQTVKFDNCTFIRNSQREEFCTLKLQGAFVGHASNNNVNNQYLIMDNNKFISNYGMAASFIMQLAGEKGATIIARNNSFWSEELLTDNCVDYNQGESILSSDSNGNTATALNFND